MTPRRASVLTAVVAVLGVVLVAPTSASAAVKPASFEKRVVDQLNVQRQEADKPEVLPSTCAGAFANRWARMAQEGRALPGVAKARTECGGPVTRAVAVRKHATPAATVRGLTRSPQGRRSMLDRRARRVGVGAVKDSRGRWTTVVVLTGKPKSPDAGTSLPPEAAAMRAEIISETNKRRKAHGLAPFTSAPCATTFGQQHSTWMAETDTFEHSDLTGLLATCADASFVGENIAYLYESSGSKVVQMWMDSPGHRANILNPKFTHLGVGVALDPESGRWYTTQNFTDSQG